MPCLRRDTGTRSLAGGHFVIESMILPAGVLICLVRSHTRNGSSYVSTRDGSLSTLGTPRAVDMDMRCGRAPGAPRPPGRCRTGHCKAQARRDATRANSRSHARARCESRERRGGATQGVAAAVEGRPTTVSGSGQWSAVASGA